MTTATPEDVRQVIDTSLEDSTIQGYIDRAQEDNELVNDTDKMGETQLRRIEELLAAIKILSYRKRERSTTQESIGSRSKTYERGLIRQLRGELSKYDPSNKLGSMVTRDTDRTVRTTAED